MPADSPAPSDDEQWIVTSCKACGRDVKLPKEAEEDLAEMACPYCSARLGGEHEGEDALATAPRRRRVSQAGRGAEDAPDWDQTRKKEADDEDLNEYVEVDPNNPGGVRVRRVRRKRTLTTAEKVVRTLAMAFVGLAVLGGLAILIIAIVKGTGTVNKDVQTAAELPQRIQELIADAKANQTIPPVLTEAETKASEAILRGFLEADGWADKVPFVHKPERAALRMPGWYSRPENSDAAVRVGKIVRRDKIFDQNRAIIKIAIETNHAEYKIFALRQTLDDIKIDWESSAGYQEMTLEEFQQERPTTGVPFRVYIQVGDYYNHEFSDPDTHQCFLLTYPGNPDFRIYGYANRGAPELSDFLDKARFHKFSGILELRYPSPSEASNQVEISAMVSSSWFE